MPDTTNEVLRHLGEIDPTMLEGVVDTGPTLETWASVQPIIADMNFVMGTMAAAYDAAVYSIGRHKQELGKDAPVGAAIGDPGNIYYQGFAQDKELNDLKAHAEVMALRNAYEIGEEIGGIDLGGLTLAATVEPCPGCLEAIGNAGIKRVVYGTSRRELEAIGFVKPHGMKAAEIVKQGRILSKKYGFEFFQIPNRAVQSACLELFVPFQRDTKTERVIFDRTKANATRFARFAAELDETASPDTQRSERLRVAEGFASALGSFYRKIET